MGQTITLRPIYGWGWVSGSIERRDVPASFSVELDVTTPGKWRGTVISAGHEFFGLVADLTQRHAEWDGHVNVQLRYAGFDDLPQEAGYAQVANHLSLARAAD